MKIFSNFDTALDDRLFDEAKAKFGDDKVLFVRRDKIYLILKVWVPIGIWFLFSSFLLLRVYAALGVQGGFGKFLAGLIWLIVIVCGLRVTYTAIRKLIDYYMDYTIVTPMQVMQYDQTGILSRSSRSLDIAKIKSVSIDKKGLLRSIFDFGTIVFFSEGDQAMGDIKLNYISKPILLRDTITDILDMHADDGNVTGTYGK